MLPGFLPYWGSQGCHSKISEDSTQQDYTGEPRYCLHRLEYRSLLATTEVDYMPKSLWKTSYKCQLLYPQQSIFPGGTCWSCQGLLCGGCRQTSTRGEHRANFLPLVRLISQDQCRALQIFTACWSRPIFPKFPVVTWYFILLWAKWKINKKRLGNEKGRWGRFLPHKIAFSTEGEKIKWDRHLGPQNDFRGQGEEFGFASMSAEEADKESQCGPDVMNLV